MYLPAKALHRIDDSFPIFVPRCLLPAATSAAGVALEEQVAALGNDAGPAAAWCWTVPTTAILQETVLPQRPAALPVKPGATAAAVAAPHQHLQNCGAALAAGLACQAPGLESAWCPADVWPGSVAWPQPWLGPGLETVHLAAAQLRNASSGGLAPALLRRNAAALLPQLSPVLAGQAGAFSSS